MTPSQRLENWGNWSNVATGRPKGYPVISPMFQGHAQFKDSAWGPNEAAPEPARPAIFEADAIKVDVVIRAMDRLDQALLKNAFVLKFATWKRLTPDQYQDALAGAIAEFGDRAKAPSVGKPRVLEMLEAKCWTTGEIAVSARVSRQYVWQIVTGKS